MSLGVELAERGWAPMPLVRWGVRRLLADRLRQQATGNVAQRKAELFQRLRSSPVAVSTEEANQQHYELPAEFFELFLGRRRKYSSCLWPVGVDSLEEAEEAMLRTSCERAQIVDGMEILELGCGWGSMALWIAERYPLCRVVAVSNSHGQRKYIEAQCASRGFDSIKVVTADVNTLTLDRTFDRVVSVEMFEHMRNYEQLLAKIARWLRPDGRLFVHLFCHDRYAYPYETDGEDDWMARYFFTGGMMPSFDTLAEFQRDLILEQSWRVDGTHYERTLLAWLDRLDQRRSDAVELLGKVYGPANAGRWFQRWRLFLIACAELFGYRSGREWLVGHYLLQPK